MTDQSQPNPSPQQSDQKYTISRPAPEQTTAVVGLAADEQSLIADLTKQGSLSLEAVILQLHADKVAWKQAAEAHQETSARWKHAAEQWQSAAVSMLNHLKQAETDMKQVAIDTKLAQEAAHKAAIQLQGLVQYITGQHI